MTSICELAHLASDVEHVGGGFFAGAAGDAAVGVEDGAVARDERGVREVGAARAGASPERADAHRGSDVVDDDGVTDDDAHERLVLGREAERVGEAADDAFDAARPASRRS